MKRASELRRTPFPAPLNEDGTPRWSSLTRHQELGRGTGFQGARLALVAGDGAPVVTLRARSQHVTPSTIPPDVLTLVDARDGHMCVRCGREREVIEHHHRRIKGIGGDTRAHTECPCCIISACPWWAAPTCHAWIHANRIEAEAEGLVIPRAAEFPFLYSVLVHGRYDAGVQRAWPTCDGRWDTDEPIGALT